MKIVVCDRLEPQAEARLQQQCSNLVLLQSPDRDEIICQATDADALIVRSHTTIDRSIIEACPSLRVIGRAGSGSYNIDVEAASKNGIVVLHTPVISSTSTAELTIALMIGAARKLGQAVDSLQQGLWDRGALKGIELSGETLGIVGYGNIGKRVGEIARAMGMEVLAHDPYVRYQPGESPTINMLERDEMLRRSRVVVVTCPLTDETRGMCDGAFFNAMADDSLFVNVGHGLVVDEEALVAAIDQNKLFGAALDVFAQEPADAQAAVVAHPRILTTPHIGAATRKAQEGVCQDVVDKVLGFLESGYISGSINMPVIGEGGELNISGYVDLAGKLASMVSQLDEETSSLQLHVHGRLAFGETSALESRVAREFLQARNIDANDINGRFLLGDHRISFSLHTREQGASFVNEVQLQTDNYRIKGTLLADKYPRIVEVNEFKVEAIPQGTMLFFRNYDRPGVIGNLGQLLGARNINVANMRLGFRGDDEAIAMVNIDTTVDSHTIDEITRIENIIDCYQLEFT
ncbi:NAD(P)-dependent oxidoreductase [Desulfurispira natronophila]|uniref:D-3-phosphoglycerate dehydrogenase n=1 Tax=Desulfurispira natronophila TaxID=682562 RepID=A0A7W7Y4K8_9BACT|nr:NAD(P)-dependent oxidoreductase [Desulfurispira natronophila]MBB5021988.1 D-3-phosphoglycerate dehydrogenase [Desulfurispira natronophila]